MQKKEKKKPSESSGCPWLRITNSEHVCISHTEKQILTFLGSDVFSLFMSSYLLILQAPSLHFFTSFSLLNNMHLTRKHYSNLFLGNALPFTTSRVSVIISKALWIELASKALQYSKPLLLCCRLNCAKYPTTSPSFEV